MVQDRSAGPAPALVEKLPELLEAARLTVQHFKRKHRGGAFQGDDEHEAWTALEAAIAKVEGRS